ncbi:type IV secretory system conjugative DNA transfer family protein [Oleiharenicola sp. Vm1]|uniref:type IV secretory system conjugative DNA transfer family protein n=1 Tax=Oleiharenicola sp. Vm1 TaxID=3398393 RepID=UPI0039F61CE4
MTRLQYCGYLVRRIAEAFLIFGAALYAVHWLQLNGWVQPTQHRWLFRATNAVLGLFHYHYASPPGWMLAIQWWTWPACFGFLTHICLGPKQQRPIFLRVPGKTWQYGHTAADRNAAARGGLITGATGSGKSQICFNPLFHSVTINECGRERPAWRSSRSRPLLESARKRFRKANDADRKSIAKLADEHERATEAANAALDKLVAELFTRILEWQAIHPGKPFTPQIAGALTDELNRFVGFGERPPDLKPHQQTEWMKRSAARKRGELLTIDRATIVSLFDRLATLQRLEAPAPLERKSDFDVLYETYRDRAADAQEIDEKMASLNARIAIRRLEFQKFADPLKPLRFQVAPWGGLVADEKGNQWQVVSQLFSHYNRDEDLMLIQTRPNDAPPGWTPPARFNLLSFDDLPADTYAKLIVDTGLAIEGSDKPDEFFVPQARDKIGWGIKLMRAVRAAQMDIGEQPEKLVYPAIDKILEILTTLNNYNAFLMEVGCAPHTRKVTRTRTVFKKGANGEDEEEKIDEEVEETVPARLNTPALREARSRLENDYWSQPDEQRGGVASTIYNFLVPFTEPDVAAVFCRDNTFDLRAVYDGKVVSVALPQKFAVQRRYAVAILKTITYQLVQNRFDLIADKAAWKYRNFIWIPQDEMQRYAIEADTQVDTIREAQGTTYGGAQTQDAMWKALGGREKATPMIANLRNRWICTAATETCAEESAKLIGKYTAPKHSHSRGAGGGSSSISYEDRFFIKPHQLMALPPFWVVFAPAEGWWLYKKMIVMPVTPDGKTPRWWFGDLNPIVWLAACVGLRKWSSVIWPWQAKAPIRATIRYLLGFDGTFIVVERLSRWKARRMSNRKVN